MSYKGAYLQDSTSNSRVTIS